MGADHEAASSAVNEIAAGDEQRPLLKNDERDASKDTLIEVPRSGFGFNSDYRPCRDVAYAIVFLVFVVASLGVGIFAAINQNPEYQWVESASHDRHKGCGLSEGLNRSRSLNSQAVVPSRGFQAIGRSLLSVDVQSEISPYVKALLYVLLATCVLMAPLAFFLLWLLRTYTKELVYATLPFCFIIPLALNITWFVACNRSQQCTDSFPSASRYFAFVSALAFIAIFAWVVYINWARVELTIRIIRTASEALHKNLGLLLVLPALGVGYFVYLIPATVFLFYAYTNGKYILNPEIDKDPELMCGGNSGRKCCVWKADSWVPAYETLTIFSILWAAVVTMEIHVYTISGTIAQWYFATTQTSTVRSTKRSLCQAFGPSFGTLCFSGLIVAFVRMIRGAIESARANRGHVGIAAIVLRACLQCILSAVEFLTKFTTNFAAITGEGFCASALMTYHLLKRNLLSTLVVETISGRLLGQAACVIAAVYGLVVWGILWLLVENGKSLWSIAFFAFSLLCLFLCYGFQILLHVVDTVYICYAMDVDYDEVSKPAVHDVYVLLPTFKDENASLAVPRAVETF